MSLSNVKVKFIIDQSGWRDSLHYRPAPQDEIWVCNGEGGPVLPTRYVGAESGCLHGLYTEPPSLRDDHYFWMPRHPGTPPVARFKPMPRVQFDPDSQDRWIHSITGLPSIGETVWIDDNVVGPIVARLDEIEHGGPNHRAPVFRAADGAYKYTGHRYWAMLMPPKRPFV